jgi:Arc/MetJ family transcription regulator
MAALARELARLGRPCLCLAADPGSPAFGLPGVLKIEARQVASSDVVFDAVLIARCAGMRTTLNIDDNLLSEAQRLSGLTEKAALVREALQALIERESARRLARLGGSEPQLKPVPRRKSNLS